MVPAIPYVTTGELPPDVIHKRHDLLTRLRHRCSPIHEHSWLKATTGKPNGTARAILRVCAFHTARRLSGSIYEVPMRFPPGVPAKGTDPGPTYPVRHC